MNSYTVEVVLDVEARDEQDAERIGRRVARLANQESEIRGAVVADVRPDDSLEERQP